MKYRLLGRSGLRVSELCLGCATFGTNWGSIGSDEQESGRIFDAFVEAGGNFFDTSNRYQEGQSEQILGGLIQRDRDRYVIASKYSLQDGLTDGTDPNGCGNHRKNLFRSVEGSLKRLKTDYLDMLWIHIYDYSTPVEEVMRALDDLVRQGKVHYVGASNFPAWWIARANTLAEQRGWTPFVATQLEYAITERSCEPEFLPMTHELDLALVAWSPLGGGICTGKYNQGPLDSAQPHRLVDEIDPEKRHYWHQATRRNLAIMDKVIEIADEIGRPTAQVALRWLLQQKVVTIPIFSARTLEQAEVDLGSVDFELTAEQMAALSEVSRPAIGSIMPDAGAYPYPMLEYGSPALPEFYSRQLLYGQTESAIVNHRRAYPYLYHRPATQAPVVDGEPVAV
ncbi:aldo/keto reductase [Candidatus Laterigemmans baculatus]|uniref:aldo/keto reductase n=1 Tax=Candidatus Laterigemmans baculatus TaxID=2770505 RepID=UPI0013DAC351|nr:aldo/keto reductase [Candidatus Laterigemmans baculatus]